MLIRGYDAAITALLRNLLDNALRHAPRGGMVQIAIRHEQGQAILEVVDNGPGIPAERRQAVFARFHRETSTRGDGYGLGLSIVQRATELHAGSIHLLDSPYGHGLCVRVTMPMEGMRGQSVPDASVRHTLDHALP